MNELNKIKGFNPKKWISNKPPSPKEEKPPSSNRVYVSKGLFHMDGTTYPSLDIVILAWEYSKYKYPPGSYVSGQMTQPECWAHGVDPDKLTPDPKSPKVQSKTCAACWADAWKSAGKAKACPDRRDMMFFEKENYNNPHTYSLPSTSLNTRDTGWKAFASKFAGRDTPPIYAFVTRLTITDVAADQYKIKFEIKEAVADKYEPELKKAAIMAADTLQQREAFSKNDTPNEVRTCPKCQKKNKMTRTTCKKCNFSFS